MANNTVKSKSFGNRRDYRENSEREEHRKFMRKAIIVTVVTVVLFAGALVVNSSFLRTSVKAVSVGGESYSAAEFDYFFQSAYNEYYNQYAGLLDNEQFASLVSSMLPDRNKPLAGQINGQTGQLWTEYFEEDALRMMQEFTVIYTEAKKENFVLSDEKRAEMEEQITLLRESYSQYGFTSFDQYLKQVYGSSMNEKIFLNLAEKSYLASAYEEYKSKSIGDAFSKDVLDAYYAENKDNLDTITFRYFMLNAATPEPAENETEEETAAIKDAALQEVIAKANELRSAIHSEADFIAVAREYDATLYAEDNSTIKYYAGEQLGSTEYGAWLLEAARKGGDVTTIETSSGCYIVYFISRDDNRYETVTMRQLLVVPAEVDAAAFEANETDDEYNAALVQAGIDAKTKADDLYSQWEAAGFTEDKLIELMENNTADTASDNGLYENIYKHQRETEIDEWLFADDPARITGDHANIKSGENDYHLVYFKEHGEPYNYTLAKDKKQAADYTAWKEALGTPEYKKHWAFKFCQ